MLLLPDLPTDPAILSHLAKLAAIYLRVDAEGRNTPDTIAEAEARYSATRSR